jgi:hypothetical protein
MQLRKENMYELSRPRRRGAVALVGAVASMLAVLVFSPAALAARDPISGGSTDLHMKKGFVRKLANNQVSVQGVGSGTVTGNKMSMPVDGGKLDPTNAQGFVETGGGFKFARGQRGVPIVNVTTNTVKGAVYANIARTRMQLGELVMVSTSREGFGARVKAVKLVLNAKSAQRISNRLGLKGSKRINPGRVLSNVFTAPTPRTVTLVAGGSATLAGDAGTLAKFGAKGVEIPAGIGAIAPATKPTPTSFELPVSGGSFALDGSDGTVQTAGGVQIVKQAEPFSPAVRMSKIAVDFKGRTALVDLELLPAPPLPGAVGRTPVADVQVEGSKIVTNPVTRQIAVAGVAVRLQTGSASTLNNVFNQPAPAPPPASNFVVGDPLGTFSMTLQAQ